jgi:murein DD-endopeptidase MepM/ murein hydrolase activator NlpD
MTGLLLAMLLASGVPGGAVAIPVADDTIEALFQERSILLYRGHAIVALPLDINPGRHSLIVTTSTTGSYKTEFDVIHKDYPEQHLTIKNRQLVNPGTTDLNRIQHESARMRAGFASTSDRIGDPHPFIQPVEGIISSPFGHRRILNGQPRSAHSGLDIAADRGTPVHSPAAGKVVTSGEFFFNGNTVLVDHGDGLVTMFCHLQKINVAEGDKLARGQVLGLVGSTGRSTGPHLHWTVSLQGVRVDPLSLSQVLSDVSRVE